LAFLSVTGIILLFFRPRPQGTEKVVRPEIPEKLFAQVIQAAKPKLLHLWEEGDSYISIKQPLNCPAEIDFHSMVGRSYYQCQPHFWQCYWSGGVKDQPSLKIDLFGQSFHVRAKPAYEAIPAYSSDRRFYQILKGPFEGMSFHYGMLTELEVEEIPGLSWPVILTDTCRDTYLPQRIYGYGKIDLKKEKEGFIWDNFDRNIFIDRFYVSNQQVNEWRILNNQQNQIITDRKLWPAPASLPREEQRQYCNFWGKRLLEAKLFDAATMTPVDTKNPMPDRVPRPQTPWQRDLSKTFLGMARINPDYQLTPLDCQLAQVRGCAQKFYTTDSVTWMGMNFALGFYPESLVNDVEPAKNLKSSSRFETAQSENHELGTYVSWNGEQDPDRPVAFRCYEETSP
jgi:hypothetical protein